MAKSESGKSHPLLGIIFILSGVLTLVLAFLNYREDGKISLTLPSGFFMLLVGVYWYFYGRKLNARNE